MSIYADRAMALQIAVRNKNLNRAEQGILDYYTDAQLREGIVHTREDVVLLVSYMHDLNLQLRTLRWLVGALVLGMLYFLL